MPENRTVVVTGGLGRSGRWIADHLAEDWRVVCVDRTHPGWEIDARENLDFRAADLTNRGESLDLLADLDPDAVVHWAALPSPTRHAGGRVFETNVLAAYNVLVGAGRAGVRVAWASSESAYGYAFAAEKRLPDRLPIREADALRPEDPYGTSKVVGEEVAKMVSRRFDVPVASIRPSWIQYPGEYECVESRDDLANGAGNFWSYVDARDVASIVAAALDADFSGHEAFHAAAADNYLERPIEEALESFFGESPDDCNVSGDESALSVEKAEEVLDWDPDHSWRDAADEDVAGPELVRE
ncbi:NAD(P)-dependent oxidoreductase [Halorussus gelatinilyticus]|uniref:NAD(P)-dependent oxidoreductase n=1 Tax=Halorussus gelatinilyticus TaxID=2937524 RepID=A0A8U0IMD7_9EURY|nr:NAD(P)-dependent oxidoreductase [Halorussus gelatinilyticus]UPW01582.1 NAD(P)-dependent oxidoreductase [Halorussus gelatinilyticus]